MTVTKRKTPAPLAQIITGDHPALINHTEEMLRLKAILPAESLPDYIRNPTEAELIAFCRGYSACVADVMHKANCYAGFQHYGPLEKHPDGTTSRHVVTPGDPEHNDWRILYYTNGIEGQK